MVLLTLVGVSVVGNTSNEEKMARNFRDRDVAFSAAEAALRDAELRLNGSWRWPYQPLDINSYDSSCTNGLCDSYLTQVGGAAVDLTDFFASSALTSTSVIGTTTGSPTIQGVVTQPRYRIEVVNTGFGDRSNASGVKAFRITAQARGRIASTRVVLQEIYLPADSVN